MKVPFTITFFPAGISFEGDPAKTLLSLARENGLWVESACGGAGTCRSCLVRIKGSSLPRPTEGEQEDLSVEELASGWRRSCQTRVVANCSVSLGSSAVKPYQSRQEKDGEKIPFSGQPFLVQDKVLQCWVDSKGTPYGGLVLHPPLGLAFDLGTTNISVMLIDLSTGDILKEKGMTNPQVYFGADVISRITYAMKSNECSQKMQSVVVDALQQLADDVSDQHSDQVCAVAVAGNTVMHHALYGFPLENLASAPYFPVEIAAMEGDSNNIGLSLSATANLYTPPNIAGFIGGDHVAALAEILSTSPPDCWAMIDIGTNTEIALYVNGKIYSASCASGPAFEGGHVSCGMRASTGAIEKVLLEGDRLSVFSIDSETPIGICGSGIISITANLCRNQLINKRGRLQLESTHIRERNGKREFVLYDQKEQRLPVVFTQQDIRSVQLAKGAIMTGLTLLMARAGIVEDNLKSLYVAGTFGIFIEIVDAIEIGMLPDISQDRILQIGNAAQRGISRLLTSHKTRQEVNELTNSIEYVELALVPEFQRTFIRCNQFQESSS